MNNQRWEFEGPQSQRELLAGPWMGSCCQTGFFSSQPPFGPAKRCQQGPLFVAVLRTVQKAKAITESQISHWYRGIYTSQDTPLAFESRHTAKALMYSGKPLLTSASSPRAAKEGSSGQELRLPVGLGSTSKQKGSAQELCVLGRQEGNICFCRRLCSCQEQEAQAREKKVLRGQRLKSLL